MAKKTTYSVLSVIGVLFVLYVGYVLYAVWQIKSGHSSFSELPQDQLPVEIVNNDRTQEMMTADDPSYGDPGSAVRIVEFGDFECPFCRESYPIIRKLLLERGDELYFVYRDFPLSTIHEHAQKAAEAAECAHEQGKFWPYHDKLYQNQEKLDLASLSRYAREVGLNGELFDRCLSSGRKAAEVAEDFQAGVSAGVRGTPTFFINGQRIAGVIPYETWNKILDELLKP